jgi:1,2-diacylglycerol 3-alpha-glucosyltransferase
VTVTRDASQLRVLYLSDVAAPRVNGVSTSIAVFRRELEARGHAVPLIAPRYGRETEEPGIYRVGGWRVPFDPEDRFVRPGQFTAIARSLQFDLVHVQTPFAAHVAGHRLARERNVPLVETWHTDFEHYFEHYLPLVPVSLARALARRLAVRVGAAVDHLVVPSPDVDAALSAYGIATPRTVLPTGLTVGELGTGDGARFRQTHGIAPDRPVVVHVGRIAGEKNIEFLLHALAHARRHLPDLLMIVAGEGPAKTQLQRRAVELELEKHLLWLGYLDRHTALADVYRAGDAFVFASRTETQGLVLLEAMSLGVPVVAIAERGTRQLLASARGALVPAADFQEFSQAMVRLLTDAPLRVRLGAEGRELALAWSAPVFGARLAELYRGLLEDAQNLLMPAVAAPAPGSGRRTVARPR